ncbi:MAG: hypothetical protein AB7Q45_20315 [Planctomycetaceae bacterium]
MRYNRFIPIRPILTVLLIAATVLVQGGQPLHAQFGGRGGRGGGGGLLGTLRSEETQAELGLTDEQIQII